MVGIEPLFALTITLNPKRPNSGDFRQSVVQRQWYQNWPRLRPVGV
ncbi:nucleotidyltransferase family protein [Vreelandella songnenensis]